MTEDTDADGNHATADVEAGGGNATADVEAAARELEAADSAVALTGAGVSTASGIPDFRSEGGIWEKFDPDEFRYSRFKADPAGFWERRVEMHEAAFGGDVEPNAAHDALAELESSGHLDAVITQNVDGLHESAGSDTVIELHGNASRVICDSCGQRRDAAPARARVTDGELPPRCSVCDGVLKPDVVLFGEQLPRAPLQGARTRAREVDVFLAAGSSLSVEPAASLPQVAARNGATLILVNLEETRASASADYEFRADVTTVLPELVDCVEQ